MIRTIWLATILVFHMGEATRREQALSVASAQSARQPSLRVPADDIGGCAGELARCIVLGAGRARHRAGRGAYIVA